MPPKVKKGSFCYSTRRYPLRYMRPDYIIIKRLSKSGQSDVFLVEARKHLRTMTNQKIKPGSLNILKVYKDLPFTENGHSVLKKHFSRSSKILRRLRTLAQGDNSALIFSEAAAEFHGEFWLHEYDFLKRFNFNYFNQFPQLIDYVNYFLIDPAAYEKGKRWQGWSFWPEPLVIEYLPGDVLVDIFKRNQWPIENVDVVIRSLLQKVEILQRESFIHKDITPKNVIVSATGESKLIDFAFSDYLEDDYYYRNVFKNWSWVIHEENYVFDNVSEFIGGRRCRPPETYCGFISPKNDSYSIGALIFSCFTGEHIIPIYDGREMRSFLIGNPEPTSKDKNSLERTMLKILGRTRCFDKFDNILADRLEESIEIPNDYKEAIFGLCRGDPVKRSRVNKILNKLGIKPIEKIVPPGWKRVNKDKRKIRPLATTEVEYKDDIPF